MKDALDFTKHRKKEASIKLANESDICEFVSNILAIDNKYIKCSIMSNVCIIKLSEELWINKLVDLYNTIGDNTMMLSNNSLIIDYNTISSKINSTI